ncbi:50S ribosomal protein L37ae [Halorhabdus salina]|uniref:50S ribosomal protein L37ae n=1 Tax=Halorhabdus salina TaxID=2750670 RepID=UPI0015EF2361|nr:50S ribosomal protein L37ae [Halorhabdus salina]
MAERGETGSAGRFGARYGRVARRRVAQIEEDMRDEHKCPECGEDRVSRQGTGIWECSYCGYTFTGGAYSPQTPGGRAAERSIRAALAETATEEE